MCKVNRATGEGPRTSGHLIEESLTIVNRSFFPQSRQRTDIRYCARPAQALPSVVK